MSDKGADDIAGKNPAEREFVFVAGGALLGFRRNGYRNLDIDVGAPF